MPESVTIMADLGRKEPESVTIIAHLGRREPESEAFMECEST